MADEQPVAVPDQLQVELEVVRIGVEGLLQAEASRRLLISLNILLRASMCCPRILRTELVVMEGGLSAAGHAGTGHELSTS
jgi:hypothetical protein